MKTGLPAWNCTLQALQSLRVMPRKSAPLHLQRGQRGVLKLAETPFAGIRHKRAEREWVFMPLSVDKPRPSELSVPRFQAERSAEHTGQRNL